MAAGGVARNEDFRRVAAIAGDVFVDPSDAGAGLPDNVGDGYLRAKIVFDEHNGRAAVGEGCLRRAGPIRVERRASQDENLRPRSFRP